MGKDSFAVVSYLPGKLGNFIDSLRRRFDPALAAWLAHVTILPPRPLDAPLEAPLETIRRRCALFEPVEVSIDAVSTFWPVSGVVYLSLSSGADRLAQLHDTLNSGLLSHDEPHPYVPHITIAQELDEGGKKAVLADVKSEWARYRAEALFRVESLFLVQKTPENRWVDLAPIRLGGLLAGSRK